MSTQNIYAVSKFGYAASMDVDIGIIINSPCMLLRCVMGWCKIVMHAWMHGWMHK